MRIALQLATPDDASDLVALTASTGGRRTEKATLFVMRTSSVYIARRRGKLIATLTLSTKKPWAIDKTYFAASRRPLYLTAMEVHPDMQRQGVGRLCIEEARRIALEWPADAIRLDAYDRPDGAGDFYRKCGFSEVGRATYRNTPLIYFEMQL